MQQYLLLIFPVVLILVILVTRYVLLWLDRKVLRDHALRLYMGALHYIEGNTTKKDLDILATREAFYSAVVTEQKVYRSLVKKLADLLQTKDKSLLESIEYLQGKAE